MKKTEKIAIFSLNSVQYSAVKIFLMQGSLKTSLGYSWYFFKAL